MVYPFRTAARRLEACCRAILVLAAVALPVIWLWPHSFREARPVVVAWVWAISMARTFCVEIGIGLGGIAMAFAAGRHRRAAAAALVVACAWAAPIVSVIGERRGDALHGPRLTVMTCNVLGRNRDYDAIMAEIERADPDIVALQEYTAAMEDAMGDWLRQKYPHVATAWWNERFGMAIFSRLEFAGGTHIVPAGMAGRDMLRAEVELDGRRLAMYNVHPSHPAGIGLVAQGRAEFADILAHTDAERVPLVIMGDFNASTWSPQDEALATRGFRDAFDEAGTGYGATWPVRGLLSFVPSVRIDHVYVGRDVGVASCRVGGDVGSDHRPMIARVGWR